MVHVEGQLGGEYVRQSTGTRAWSQAVQLLKKAERLGVWEGAQPVPESTAAGKSIAEVVDEYLTDCESAQGRRLAKPELSPILFT